jgi:two-component system NarL family sensor kinase
LPATPGWAAVTNPASYQLRAAAYAAVGVALAATCALFAYLADVGWATFVNSYTLTNLVIGLGLLLPGAAIRWFQQRNRIGTLLIVSGLGALGTACAAMLMSYGLDHRWPGLVLRVLTTIYIGAWQLGIGFCFYIAILLFPTQQLLSARWRPILWLIVIGGVYQMGTGILSPARLNDDPRAVSIISIGLDVTGQTYNDVMGLLGLVVTAALLAGLVIRYRRGTEQVKRQILWLLLALIAFILINGQRWVTGDGPILLLLSIVLIPIAIGVAIVRYELFDIRLVVSRTLVYTATLAIVIGAYAGLVALLSLIITDQMRRGVPVSAALVVAIVFNPVRLHLQRLIDRAFYGSRADPAGTARHIAAHLQQSDELTDVLDRARNALRLPWMALHQATDSSPLAEVGTPGTGTPASIGLTYRGTAVGTLHLHLRRGEATLHDADRHTLDLICTPLAIALHATALTEQVRQARAATVEAAAAERVRLQRELHDGLGPTLTSIAFRADAATNTLRTDTDVAEQLMGEISTDLRDVIDDVRRIVYGLRPIELDDLGLLGAVRQQITATAAGNGHTVAIELNAPDALPDLSPAVELAAYRIIMESITNVRRHSTARTCAVTVVADGHLTLKIADDGAPNPAWRPGIGIRSIRERADELGGTASAGPDNGGWTVQAQLPLALLDSQD